MIVSNIVLKFRFRKNNYRIRKILHFQRFHFEIRKGSQILQIFVSDLCFSKTYTTKFFFGSNPLAMCSPYETYPNWLEVILVFPIYASILQYEWIKKCIICTLIFLNYNNMLHNTINCALFVHMLLLNCNLHFLHIAFHSVIKVVCAFFETTTNNTQKMRVILPHFPVFPYLCRFNFSEP